MANPVVDLYNKQIEGTVADAIKGLASATKITESLKDSKSANLQLNKKTLKEVFDKLDISKDIKSASKTIEELKKFVTKNPQLRMGGARKESQSWSRDMVSELDKRMGKKSGIPSNTVKALDKMAHAAVSGHSLSTHDHTTGGFLGKILSVLQRMFSSKSGIPEAPSAGIPEDQTKKTKGKATPAATVANAAATGAVPVVGQDSGSARLSRAMKRVQHREMRASIRDLNVSLDQQDKARANLYAYAKAQSKLDEKSKEQAAQQVNNLVESVQNFQKLNWFEKLRLQWAVKRLATEKLTREEMEKIGKLTESFAARERRRAFLGPAASAVKTGLERTGSFLAGMGDLDEFRIFDIITKAAKEGARYTKDMSAALYETKGLTGDVLAGTNELQSAYHEIGLDTKQLYLDTGQTSEVVRKQLVKNLRRGINEQTALTRVTKQGLATATLIGSEAESTAEEFADWYQQLQLSAGQTAILGRNIQHVGRMTGVTGDRLLEAVKSSKELAQQMKFAGNYTEEAARHMIQLTVTGKKYGVEGATGKIQKALTSRTDLFASDDKTLSFLSQAAARGGVLQQLQTGQIRNDPAARKQLGKGMKSLFDQFTGGRKVSELSPLQRSIADDQMMEAFGVRIGEAEHLMKAWNESLLTSKDKIELLDEELKKTTVTEKRGREIALEKQALETEILREKTTKELEGLNNIAEFIRGNKGVTNEEVFKKYGKSPEAMTQSLDSILGNAQSIAEKNKQILEKESSGIRDKLTKAQEAVKMGMPGASTDVNTFTAQLAKATEMRSKEDKQVEAIAELRKNLAAGVQDPKKLLEILEQVQDAATSGDIKVRLQDLDAFTKAEFIQKTLLEQINKSVQEAQAQIVNAIGPGNLVAINVTIGLVKDVMERIYPVLRDILTALGPAGALLGALGVTGVIGNLLKFGLYAGGVVAIGVLIGEILDQVTEKFTGRVREHHERLETAPWNEHMKNLGGYNEVLSKAKNKEDAIRLAEKNLQEKLEKMNKAQREFSDDEGWTDNIPFFSGIKQAFKDPQALHDAQTEAHLAKRLLEELKQEGAKLVPPGQMPDPSGAIRKAPSGALKPPSGTLKTPVSYTDDGPQASNLTRSVVAFEDDVSTIATSFADQERSMRRNQASMSDTPTSMAMQEATQVMDQIAVNTGETALHMKALYDWFTNQPMATDTRAVVKPKSPANYWSWSIPTMSGNMSAGATNPTSAV